MKWFALLVLAACAGRTGEMLTDTGDLAEASGAPRIDTVAELGGGDVILTADVQAAPGDGVATVGEALWVRGVDFGRQPTVTIAGRPAAVLARTVDGGLVARVPPGVPVGVQPLTVTNHKGRGDHTLTVRRLVLTVPPRGGRLALAELAADGPRAAGEIPAAGQQVQVAADGRAAYVLDTAAAQLSVFDLAAQQGPRRAAVVALPGAGAGGPVISFAAAAAAPALMILRPREIVLLDITAPLRPVRTQPRPLPAAIQRGTPIRGALSPDGATAAVVLEQGNGLVLLDLRQGGVTLVGELSLAPQARVPVIADVAFVADGRTVWVALGDTEKSRAVGPQPTELVAVRIQSGGRNGAGPAPLTVARRVLLEEAQSPVRLNTGRAIPLASGASIRLPPERAAVYLTARNRSGVVTVFRLGADDRAIAFVAAADADSAGAADLSPDGRWLLVPAVSSRAGGRLQLVTAPADDHPGPRRVLELGAAARGPAGAAASGDLPSVACQP